ncbi:hypothetical protein JCM12294_36930 [Desulfocicer niacini]
MGAKTDGFADAIGNVGAVIQGFVSLIPDAEKSPGGNGHKTDTPHDQYELEHKAVLYLADYFFHGIIKFDSLK